MVWTSCSSPYAGMMDSSSCSRTYGGGSEDDVEDRLKRRRSNASLVGRGPFEKDDAGDLRESLDAVGLGRASSGR